MVLWKFLTMPGLLFSYFTTPCVSILISILLTVAYHRKLTGLESSWYLERRLILWQILIIFHFQSDSLPDYPTWKRSLINHSAEENILGQMVCNAASVSTFSIVCRRLQWSTDMSDFHLISPHAQASPLGDQLACDRRQMFPCVTLASVIDRLRQDAGICQGLMLCPGRPTYCLAV